MILQKTKMMRNKNKISQKHWPSAKQLSLAVTAGVVAMLSGCLSPTASEQPVHTVANTSNTALQTVEALGRLSVDVDEETILHARSDAPNGETQRVMPEETVSLMRALGQRDADSTDTVRTFVAQAAVNEINQVSSETLTALTQGGHAEVGFDSSFDHGLTGSIRLWTPLFKNDSLTIYTQEGVMRTEGDHGSQNTDTKARVIGHLGLGLRYFPLASDQQWSDLMLGLNGFVDEDFTRHHRRASLGAEFGANEWLISGNIYRRLTDWRQSEDFTNAMVEERPANGWDLRAKWWVPYKTNLAVTGHVAKWEGDRVSTFGAKNQFGKDPTVYGIGLEYRPVPAIVMTAQHEWDKDDKNTEIGVKFNIPLSADWADAFSKTDTQNSSRGRRTRDSFVERDYSMPLEYRNKPGTYQITPCPSAVRNGHCVRITNGFDEPVIGLPVSITPQSACVALNQNGKYRTGTYGEVNFSVVSSCTRFTQVDVEAGKTTVTLPISIGKLTWTMKGHPEVLRFGETSIIELSSGEFAMAGLPVKWTVKGGHLAHADTKTNANGIARATFVANELAGELRSAIVTAYIEQDSMRLPLMVMPMDAQAELSINPQRVTPTSASIATVEGLLPYERVTWELSSGTDVRLHKTEDATSGVKSLASLADKLGRATVYLKVREGNNGEAQVDLNVIPERSASIRQSFTVVHQDAGVDGTVGTRLSLSVQKTSVPKDALSGNQTLTATLRGGQRDGAIHWSATNGVLSTQDTTFDKCTGRGCQSSVVLTGAEPYEGEAVLYAEHKGIKKQYAIEYRNYDQAVLGLIGKPTAIEYEKPFEAEVVGVMPESTVLWMNGLSARPTATSSQADENGRATMTYSSPVNFDLSNEQISVQYQRNVAQLKTVQLTIPLVEWTEKLLLTVSKPVLQKGENAVFTLSGGRAGASVTWRLTGPGTIVSQETVFDTMGNARLTLKSDTATPNVKSTVTASVKKSSLSKDVQFVEYAKDFCERCFYGEEAIAPSMTLVERTVADAKATFPVNCLATQGSMQIVVCNEIFVQSSQSSCKPGTTQSVLLKSGLGLEYDLCEYGDQMTVTYKCGEPHLLTFELNGYPPTQLTMGSVSGSITNKVNSQCHASIRFLREECSGDTCVATVDARIHLLTHLQGTLSGEVKYVNENVEDQGHWEDQCGDYRP